MRKVQYMERNAMEQNETKRNGTNTKRKATNAQTDNSMLLMVLYLYLHLARAPLWSVGDPHFEMFAQVLHCHGMAWHCWQSNDYGSCREDLPSLLSLLLLLLLYYDAQALLVGILVLILATTFEEYCTVRSTLRYDTEYSEREQHHYGGNRAPIFG
jgi:hypothetical protein